jgi:hypothetical protein
MAFGFSGSIQTDRKVIAGMEFDPTVRAAFIYADDEGPP